MELVSILGLDKGCVGIVTNDNYYEHVSEEQAAAIDQAKQDIIDGKIKCILCIWHDFRRYGCI